MQLGGGGGSFAEVLNQWVATKIVGPERYASHATCPSSCARSPRNTLVFKVDDDREGRRSSKKPAVECKYDIRSSSSKKKFARIVLHLRQVRLKPPPPEDDDDDGDGACGVDSALDHVEVADPWGDVQRACVTSKDDDSTRQDSKYIL